ncbi:MAG: tetraacyldisaccharide 4'-kinase [Crocinitomicaceae bacterium]
MKWLRFLLFPFSLIYWCVTMFRNFLFNSKIKRSLSFSLPIINVGNLSMGGTGKSPHTEYLVKLLKNNYNVATLSRGYGRKVYGFQIADANSSAHSIGDEPFQFFRKFGKEIIVAVDADRVNGVTEICYQKPETDVVLLDDAYQHRNIKPGLNILLTDYSNPFFTDYILPVGNLREAKTGKNRADIVVVTKCPSDFKKAEGSITRKTLKLTANQKVFYSRIVYGEIKSLTNFNILSKTKKNIVLVTGIAKAEPLRCHLAKTHNICKHFEFADHYRFKKKDIVEIHDILIKFANDNPVVVTTEKDAMRLLNEDLLASLVEMPWFYQEISVEFNKPKEFKEIIEKYVQENSRDYRIHS